MPIYDNNVYSIVNSITEQALGKTALTVVDEQSLIAMGDYIFNNNSLESWYNKLMLRIGKTIISGRRYSTKFKGLLRDDYEWGAVTQKISTQMPSAEEDDSYGVNNGESVDMYKVNRLNVVQKLFFKSAPYQFHITIYREEQLKKAFLSGANMEAFINSQFLAVQNKFEMIIESMGRNAINNYIAEVGGTAREYKLVTMYNTERGLEGDALLTPQTALFDPDFLRYVIAKFQEISSGMEEMKTLYNDGSIERHTPRDLQKMFMWTRFSTALGTVAQYSAFQEQYLRFINPINLNFFQSSQSGSENTVKVNRSSDGTEKTVNNIVGVLFDYEALGTYKEDVSVDTTPFNAAGLYSNTFWHYNKMYFNDLSENFILFTLN